jgi:hypothetical protein
MARYLQTADKASEVLDQIMHKLKDHPDKELLLTQIIYLFNMGIRISPRGVQATVRLNAVKEAAKNQPVRIFYTTKEYTDRYGNKGSYQAINIQASANTSLQEGDDAADE